MRPPGTHVPVLPGAAGAQETQRAPGWGEREHWQTFPSNFPVACCFSGLCLPWVQGPGEGAVGDWNLATSKQTACPLGLLPRRSLDPGASLSSPFPQGLVPSWAGAQVAGQRPPKTLGTKGSLEKAPRPAAPRARLPGPPTPGPELNSPCSWRVGLPGATLGLGGR